MKKIAFVFITLYITLFSCDTYAAEKERNILQTPDREQDMIQEKIKSSLDEKNVISDADDRDEDSLIKNKDDAFELNPDPDECIL